MGWTIAGVGWGRATGGVALAFAALAGSHESVRAQTAADSAGKTLSPPYGPTLAAVDGLATWTRTAAGDLRADPGETIEVAPSRNTVTIARNTAVCDRTEQVRDEIVAAVPGVTDCADVTDAHLAAIASLNLRSGSIMALAAGDFAGLTSLERLHLDENRLTSLPDGVLAGLTSLKWLSLDENRLTSLPDGVLAGLISLETLHLDENRLTSLPDGVFAGMISLRHLYLDENHLTSLPDGVFAGLASLEWLWLYENRLTSLPDGIFAGLASLEWLLLGDNQLTSLPDGVFAGLTSLERLVLDGNRLTSLPDGVFAGLTSLEALWLSKNRLTSLPDGVFAGLASLGTLGMTQNRLTSLPDGVFAGLASLETLVLYGNRLTSLPDGVFAGLASLELLNLTRNTTDPLVVTLEKVGESRFKAVAPAGAPFEFVLPVSAANGSIEGDSTAIRIPAGAVESGPLGVTRATGTTAAVTVDIDSLPGLPSGHSGYALEKDGGLPRTILPSVSTGVTLSVSPDRVGEGDGATTLTVTATLNGMALAADTAVALTVRALTADTTDFAASTATLAISSGQTSGTAELTLTPAGDDVDEGDETVAVEGAVAGLTVTADTVTITDDDAATTGLPVISGTPRVGDTLTASVDEIEDEDGLENATFAYQWLSNNGTADTDISGATDSTYALVAADAGKTIKVRVTFTDDGTQETRVSEATDPVAAAVSSVLSVADAEATEGEDDAMEFLVTLDPAASDAVTVDYATADGTATAGEDYAATSGTLTFAAGDTTKTISVPIVDDTVDDGGETLTLTLGNASGADLGDAEATGTIRNTEDATPLTASFSDMPASHTGEDFTFGLAFSENVELSYVTLRDTALVVTGGEVKTAQRQQQGSNQAWTIAVEPASATDTVTITLPETTDCDASDAICTEDGRPLSHSLSSVVAGAVIIPAVSVSDASAAEGDAVAFTVSLSAASSQQATVEYATSDGTAAAGEDYTAESGTLTFAANETTKTVSVATTDDSADEEDETFTLTLSSPANATLGDAEATGTIRNTETAAELSADFPESAYTSKRHAGSDDRPQVVVAFSEAVAGFDKNTPSVSVTGASGLSVQAHAEDGLENAYVFFMTPDGDGDVTFALVADAACASGGICTAGGTELTQVPAALTIPGPSADPSSLSVADAEATEEEDGTMDFVVTLAPSASDAVTVDYATADATATAGEDYAATSGTLTFQAGDTTKTISVPIVDDAADDGGETFTLTLGNASSGVQLGDATATGTIDDNDNAAPLTASFSDMPASHTGEEFTFGLAFSENVELSYVTLRDTALVVTGGDVKTAQRQQQGSNQAWNVTVEPDSATDTVTVTLPETTDCDAADAICTHDDRPLSHSLSATVVDSASASAGDSVGGDAADDPLALLDGLTTDEAAEALFGERRLGEARLEALDRLGNRNGRYDLGDLLSWIERCRRGEARCGTDPADSGPASAAALLGAAAAGRRRASKRPKRRGSGHRGRRPVQGMRRRARMAGYALAMLFAATVAWSCTDDFVGPPAAGQGPGFLTVEWTGPADARDIGVLLELEGPGIETVRAPGLELYESRAPGRHRIIVAGSLRAGALLQFRVPDRGQPTLYRVRILQVTGEDYGLRDVGKYRAAITPP